MIALLGLKRGQMIVAAKCTFVVSLKTRKIFEPDRLDKMLFKVVLMDFKVSKLLSQKFSYALVKNSVAYILLVIQEPEKWESNLAFSLK